MARKKWVILGKNQEENEKLEKAFRKGDVFLAPQNFSGPSALLRGKGIDDKIVEEVKSLVLEYTKKREEKFEFTIKQ